MMPEFTSIDIHILSGSCCVSTFLYICIPSKGKVKAIHKKPLNMTDQTYNTKPVKISITCAISAGKEGR